MFSRLVLLPYLLIVAVVAAPAMCLAALPAPVWLPGYPVFRENRIFALWNPVPGAVKYNLYVNGRKFGAGSSNQYIGPPEESGEFEFRITAVDASGAESPPSAAGFVIIKPLKPLPPNTFTIVPSGHGKSFKSLELRWDRPVGASAFNIYRAESRDGPWELRASVKDAVYEDAGLEWGKPYFYTVTSKDKMGTEGDRSKVQTWGTELPSDGSERMITPPPDQRHYGFKIVPTRLTRTIRSLGEEPVETLTRMKRGPDGNFYLLSRTDQIRVLNERFEIVRRITVPVPEGSNLGKIQLWNIDFPDERTAILCDLGNKVVLIFDLDRNTVTQVMRPSRPTPEQDKAVYYRIRPGFKDMECQPLAAVRLKDGRYLVSDDGEVLHIVSAKGVSEGWRVDSIFGDPQNPGLSTVTGVIPFFTVPDLKVLEDGDVLAFSFRSSSSSNRLIRFDPKTWRAKLWIGDSSNRMGQFYDFGGMTVLPGDRVVVADQTIPTLQVFDLKTGVYLFSFGGPEKWLNPDYNYLYRALLDFKGPMYPFLLSDGSLSIYLAYERVFQVRQVLEPMP